MQDPREVQGSNADRAEGGLNPEAAFAEADPSGLRRLSLEAEANTGRAEAGDPGMLDDLAAQAPGAPGAMDAGSSRDEGTGSSRDEGTGSSRDEDAGSSRDEDAGTGLNRTRKR